jgi:hypothetical protein
MEAISEKVGDGHATAATSASPSIVPPLLPNDAELIAASGASLRAGGYAASTIEASGKRLETFARRLPAGLLQATKQDVSAFYEHGEASTRKRQAEQRILGLRPASMRYFNHPTWANFVASVKEFYSWAQGQGLIGPEVIHGGKPTRPTPRLVRLGVV